MPIDVKSAAALGLLACSWGFPTGVSAQAMQQNGFTAPQATETLHLKVGEQRVISTRDVASYSEGVPNIADVRMTKDNQHFVVVGQRPGQTSLLFLLKGGGERYFDIVVEGGSEVVAQPLAQEPPPGEDTVLPRDNIRLDFYFVQLNKDYQHDIGIGFPRTFVGARLDNVTLDLKTWEITNATGSVQAQILPRLDMAQTGGWAKLMRKAAVVTANGAEATFAGGGEVNVAVSGALSGSVQRIQYGSEIKVTPRYDRKTGRVELTIAAEISDLTNDNGTKIPGRIVSDVKSVVNLELGQSIVLGGLSARNSRESKSGIPGLSQIPVLGMLFGTHSRARTDSENLVFIIPSVAEATSQGIRAQIDEAVSAYENYKGNLDAYHFVAPPKIPAFGAPAPAKQAVSGQTAVRSAP